MTGAAHSAVNLRDGAAILKYGGSQTKWVNLLKQQRINAE